MRGRHLRPGPEYYEAIEIAELMKDIYTRLVTEQNISDKATHDEVIQKLKWLKIVSAQAASIFVKKETP